MSDMTVDDLREAREEIARLRAERDELRDIGKKTADAYLNLSREREELREAVRKLRSSLKLSNAYWAKSVLADTAKWEG